MMIGEVKSGLVLIDDTPYYYIEQFEDNGETMVVAYKPNSKEIKKYKSTHDPLVITKPHKNEAVLTYGKLGKNPKSELGKQLDRKGKNKPTKGIETKYLAPAFISLVEQGTDSVDDSFGDGFKEYVPQELGAIMETREEGKTKRGVALPDQVPSGVFISLRHVYWLKDVFTPKGLPEFLDSLYTSYRGSL